MNKKLKLVMMVGATYCLAACGMQEQLVSIMAMQNQINKAIVEACKCDMVSPASYEISTSGRHGSVQIIGSEIASKASAAITIGLALEKGVPDFCKFDEFWLVFVNKGRSEAYSIEHCKVMPTR